MDTDDIYWVYEDYLVGCDLDDLNDIKKWLYIVPATVGIVFGSISILTPSYEQLAFIVGAEWATNNEQLQQVPGNVAKVINGYLEQINGETGD